MDETTKREFRSRMKRVLTDFAAIEAINDDEVRARINLEKEMRLVPHSWEFLCGVAEGVNLLTKMYPLAAQDTTFKLVARLLIIVTAKIGLEAIQEAEDSESFPKELDNE